MGRIPQNFIDDLLSRTDIVPLIDTYVPLKKAGREYHACCPFHSEKTPSFTVSQSKQFYHCFGCGAHGTALSFLMEYQRLEFREAVDELARQAGVDVPEEMGGDSDGGERREMFAAMDRAQQYFRDGLRNYPPAVEYLKGRGLNKDIVNRFGIGYAPEGWSGLVDALRKQGVDEKLAVKAGLAARREGQTGAYDRFRQRITFPIRDSRGRIIGFGGRTVVDDSAKYLNSPETPLFHKGQHLYGLYELRQACRDLKRVMVVEGYMDVVALAQNGVPYSVATLGTATTEDHLNTLARMTPEILFCFDGDRAGRDAAWRAVERALPVLKDGCELRFMFLPQGEDPDSMIRAEGRDAFETRLSSDAVPLSQFLLDHLKAEVDLTSLDGKARLIELARPHVGRIKAPAFRMLFLGQLATLAGLEVTELEAVLGGEPVPQATMARKPVKESPGTTPVRRALQLLMEQPSLAAETENLEALREIGLPGVPLLVEVIDLLKLNPKFTVANILEHWRDKPEQRHLGKLAGMRPEIEEGNLVAEYRDCLTRLVKQAGGEKLDDLLALSRERELSADEKAELNRLLRESA